MIFLNNFENFYLFLAELGLCCDTWAFSSCGEKGLLSSCGAWASHCRGSSCYGAQAQQLSYMGLVTLSHVGSFQTRDQTCIPCIGRQILNDFIRKSLM